MLRLLRLVALVLLVLLVPPARSAAQTPAIRAMDAIADGAAADARRHLVVGPAGGQGAAGVAVGDSVPVLVFATPTAVQALPLSMAGGAQPAQRRRPAEPPRGGRSPRRTWGHGGWAFVPLDLAILTTLVVVAQEVRELNADRSRTPRLGGLVVPPRGCAPGPVRHFEPPSTYRYDAFCAQRWFHHGLRGVYAGLVGYGLWRTTPLTVKEAAALTVPLTGVVPHVITTANGTYAFNPADWAADVWYTALPLAVVGGAARPLPLGTRLAIWGAGYWLLSPYSSP